MVSVVVPVYNVEKYLERCIESIIHQTYEDIEIILIDDGSKDCSWEICKKYSAAYEHVTAVHFENHGASYARNRGIDLASGEYIQFVDSDDYIDANMIETLLNEQASRNADVVLCGYYREGEDTSVVIPNDEDCTFYMFDAVIAHWGYDPIIGSPCNKLFKTEVIRKNGISFNEGMNYAEDFCFCMEYYRHINKYSLVGKPLYHYRDTPNSLTKRNAIDVEKLWRDQLKACSSMFSLIQEKGGTIEESAGAKQAYSYMCALSFYNRIRKDSMRKNIKWIKDLEHKELIYRTKRISRVGRLNYIFFILKFVLCI